MAKDFNSYFTFIYVSLTEYEKKVLYSIIKYPTANDREIAEKAEVKQSTVAAIRKRLRKEGYFTTVAIPMLQNVGAELLVFTHASFNPVIPLSKRLEITEKKIEAFEEIVFSLGEEDKGFSIGFSKNYTDIARINDIRTKTFGKLGLLEKEYPDIAVFPFKISKTYRFFDFSHPLRETFGIDDNDNRIDNFFKIDEKNLSKNEKKLLCSIVKNPELNSKQLSSMLGLTRHTIGRLKRKFLNEGYLKIINIPDCKKLGFCLLAFYHILFDPHNPPNFEKDGIKEIINDETILMAAREFESILISIHSSYEAYKSSNTIILQKLKENGWIAKNPLVKIYSLNKTVIIKNLNFYPIVNKLLFC